MDSTTTEAAAAAAAAEVDASDPNTIPIPEPESDPVESTESAPAAEEEADAKMTTTTLPEPEERAPPQPSHVSNGSLPAEFETEIEEEEEEEDGDVVGGGGGGGGGGHHSPSSSGYAGEKGSSMASSGIEEVGDGDEDDGFGGDGGEDLVLRKKYRNEDDSSASWRKRKKHFFILSNSGKPIYSRYGDEHKLAGFSATLQAIVSYVENNGDHIKFVRAGKHQIVFLVKGPIYLVCISCTEEPYEALREQLELMYGQMILILTRSIDKSYEKNSKFDVAPLLGGTDAVFFSLIKAFSWNPATFLHAYTCIPLSHSTRQSATAVLQEVGDSGVLFALLMCRHKVISFVGSQRSSLHPDDILLLANFVLSSESFRTSESFSPICLPRYNPMAFLYAYVHFLDEDTYLILLTTSSEAFFHLQKCRERIQNVLLTSNVLSDVQRSMVESGLRVQDLPMDSSLSSEKVNSEPLTSSMTTGGPAGLWHFMYKSIYLDQYVSSEFASPINNRKQQNRLFRAYEKLYASIHDKRTGPHKTEFKRNGEYVLFCWITQDFELFAAFDPLADKSRAIKVCNRVCQWVRDLEDEIFLYGDSTFSW